MVEIISEEKYNAMSDKEKKKYDKKLERQLDKEADKVAKKGFDNAVWTYETGAKAAAVGTAAYGWYNYFNNDEDDVDGGKKRRKSLKKKRKTKRRLGGMEEELDPMNPERVLSTLTREYVNRIRPGDDFLVLDDYDNLAGTSLDPDPTRPVAVPRLYTVISVSDDPDRGKIQIIARAKNPRLTVNRMRVIDFYLNNENYNVRYANAYEQEQAQEEEARQRRREQAVRGGMEEEVNRQDPERVPSTLTPQYVNRIRPGDDFLIRNDFDPVASVANRPSIQNRLYTVISVRHISDGNTMRIIAIPTNNDLTGDLRDRRVIDYDLNNGTYNVIYENREERARGGMNDAMEKNRLYFLRRTRTRTREPKPVPESVEVFNMGELADALPINTRRKRGSYKQNSRKKRNTSKKDSKTPTSSRKRSKSLGGRRTKRRRQ